MRLEVGHSLKSIIRNIQEHLTTISNFQVTNTSCKLTIEENIEPNNSISTYCSKLKIHSYSIGTRFPISTTGFLTDFPGMIRL